MFRRLLFIFVLSSAAPASAQDSCTLKNNWCVPFVGCTSDGQEFYSGRTFGRENGRVEAIGLSGATCTGSWKRTALGAGRAQFSCSDGVKGRATYTYFDRSSGTAKGRGWTQNGYRLVFWAGHKVPQFIVTEQNLSRDMLECVKRALSAQSLTD